MKKLSLDNVEVIKKGTLTLNVKYTFDNKKYSADISTLKSGFIFKYDNKNDFKKFTKRHKELVYELLENNK